MAEAVGGYEKEIVELKKQLESVEVEIAEAK